MSSPEEQLEKAKELIPAEVRMFSGCRDEQTSADVSNVASFSLPNPNGRAGGACTSAMLNILYTDEQKTDVEYTYQEVLVKMREQLVEKGYEQIPQLSSSRPMSIKERFDLVPQDCPGTKRAVLVGINYVGHEQGQLSGCHNDVHNMVKYIKDVHGFEDENIILLLDDGENVEPTKEHIMAAWVKLVNDTKEGDAVFVHYSGHGCKVEDDNGDEADGFDETIVPLDYLENGFIRDDDIFKTLVGPLPSGVTMTAVMDCCHSGTVLDLPYVFTPGQDNDEMEFQQDYNFDHLGKLHGILQAIGGKLLDHFGGKISSLFG